MESHLVPLTGDWSLWREFAVRSAGFPVSGLDAFGSEDESTRLAEVAADPLFGEAVVWQNRSAYRNAVTKIAGAGAEGGSKRRQRDGVVAGYWQRYCSKNDTVGFFGPLAWGSVDPGIRGIEVESRALIAERAVHFESWCLEALVATTGSQAIVPLNRSPELELRTQLEVLGDQTTLAALDRLDAARAAVAEARGPEATIAALEAFDECFEDLTGQQPAPSEEGAEGGRTPIYLDCMRDLDMRVGSVVVEELTHSLPVLFEASRWWSGRAFEHAKRLIDERLAGEPEEQPLEPILEELFGMLWTLPRYLAPETQELRDRYAAVLERIDAGGSPAEVAAEAFADHAPAWPLSVYQSVDVQIAAADLDAIAAGDFLAVVGDFHPGNPLAQSLFMSRHRDPDHLRELFHEDVGRPLVMPMMARNPTVRHTSRNIPDPAYRTDFWLRGPRIAPIHVDDRRYFDVADLRLAGRHVVDPSGELRAPLTDVLAMPIFLPSMFTFSPIDPTGPRVTVGRTVLRRAGVQTGVAERPEQAADVGDWGRRLGLPRRAFCRVDGEPKPVYVDFESEALTRNLHRMLGRAAQAKPDATARFTEMLPDPSGCWLEHDGERYTCELRLVFTDSTKRGGGSVPR